MGKYVPYHKESAEKAKELCLNCKTELGKYRNITRWVKRSIAYDFIKAKEIPKKGVLIYPDVAGCWEKRLGICQDVASLTAGMLRAVGIKAQLVIGHADQFYHAWVEAPVDGKTYRFDASGKAKVYKAERKY